MNTVNVKMVNDSVIIVKSSKENKSLHTYEVNRLKSSKKLQTVRSASVYDTDLMYSVLVPKNLSHSEKLDTIDSAIKIVDMEEINDEQQSDIRILVTSQMYLNK